MTKDFPRCSGGVGRGPRHGYTGLFSPRVAPASRAYCILCSFSGGVLLMTAGSVLCHVISRHPESGGRAMHTPPLAVAIAFIVAGAIMVLASVIIICRLDSGHPRYGVDDGNDTFEEESLHFAAEDQLDQLYQQNLQQQLLIQRLIEEQIQKQMKNRREQNPCSRCSPTQGECVSNSRNGPLCSGLSSVKQTESDGGCRCRSFDRASSKHGKYSGSKIDESFHRLVYEPETQKNKISEPAVRQKEKSDVSVNSIQNEHCDIHNACQCEQYYGQYREMFSTRPPKASNEPSSSKSQSCSPSCSKLESIASLRRLKPITTSRGTSPIIRVQSPSLSTSAQPCQSSPQTTGVQGSKVAVVSNQKPAGSSKQLKMPSKIIATTDEICVVIDSQ